MATLVFGGIGAPTGMFLITGSGSITVLFRLEEMLPTLIGPWIVVLFDVKETDESG